MNAKIWRKLAAIVGYTVLWSGAIWSALGILGGLVVLEEDSANYPANKSSFVTTILAQAFYVWMVASFLFGIGMLRAYLARKGYANETDQLSNRCL